MAETSKGKEMFGRNLGKLALGVLAIGLGISMTLLGALIHVVLLVNSLFAYSRWRRSASTSSKPVHS